jgi:hypothetical protein
MSGAEFLHSGLLALAVAGVAALYASVGHGGASGYLAVMTLLSFPPAVMKPGALLLNLLVAGIGAVQYYRAGHFRFSLLWPFALTSIPLSYLGARLRVSPNFYETALALTLLWAGARLAFFTGPAASGTETRSRPRLPVALGVGAGVGLLSGIVGVGGGIFLSPLCLLLGWADPKETAALSAAFIWVNSAAGIAGHLSTQTTWPQPLALWVLAAVAGGGLGSYFGARRWSAATLRRLLGAVLFIAAVKAFLQVVHP